MELESDDDWNPNPDNSEFQQYKNVFEFEDKIVEQNINQAENDEDEFMIKSKQFKEELGHEDNPDKNFLKDEYNQAKHIAFEENLFDPLMDEDNEEWSQKNLRKTQNSKKSVVLSCPMCFTQVSYDCQQHQLYHSQYRSMIVKNCKVNCEKFVKPCIDKTKKTENQNDLDIFFSVECENCNTEIAAYEFDKKIYHFFHVIPGLG